MRKYCHPIGYVRSQDHPQGLEGVSPTHRDEGKERVSLKEIWGMESKIREMDTGQAKVTDICTNPLQDDLCLRGGLAGSVGRVGNS